MAVDYRAAAQAAAQKYGIDPGLFTAQIQQESGFNPTARSPAGAQGIAQIMPATARGWGVNPLDPIAALDAAARNMAAYSKKYGGYRNALIAYNAGPGRVGKPLYAETANYIKRIMGNQTGITPLQGQGFDGVTAAQTPAVAGGLDRLGLGKAAMQMRGQGESLTNAVRRAFAANPTAYRQAADLAAAPPGGGAAVPQNTSRSGGGISTIPGVKFTAGGANNDWGGSAQVAVSIARAAGLPFTSEKRDRVLTASGNPSDHWVGSKQSYAVDLGSGTLQSGDAALRKLTQSLGINYTGGHWLNINRGGYRIQIGWRVPGHFDHIHVGVRKL